MTKIVNKPTNKTITNKPDTEPVTNRQAPQGDRTNVSPGTVQLEKGWLWTAQKGRGTSGDFCSSLCVQCQAVCRWIVNCLRARLKEERNVVWNVVSLPELLNSEQLSCTASCQAEQNPSVSRGFHATRYWNPSEDTFHRGIQHLYDYLPVLRQIH